MVIGLVLLAGPGSSSAQESSRRPSPEELWNAYPLDPGGTSLAVDQGSPPAEANLAQPPAPSGSDDDSGLPAGVVIALAIAPAFIAGLALGRARWRATETETATAVRAEAPSPASPAAPERRFVRRGYPPPSRPAPPPPPPPGAAAATVAVPPDDERPDGRGGSQ